MLVGMLDSLLARGFNGNDVRCRYLTARVTQEGLGYKLAGGATNCRTLSMILMMMKQMGTRRI
jgi:hypothetical protein